MVPCVARILAEIPPTNTPFRIRYRRGRTEGMVRLSVGLEDVDDIIEDLRQALDRIP